MEVIFARAAATRQLSCGQQAEIVRPAARGFL
jgi:hypothetical protein